MVDFHSHFLPGMDDGAKDTKTAIEMLKTAKKQGVDTIAATPHFYCDGKTVDSFLKKRAAAYNHLMKRIHEQGEENNIPDIKLGCEVHLSISLGELEDIDKLCLEGTDYLLLEMPYQHWQPWMFDMIYSVSAQFKVIPVMAHIERYAPINKKIEVYYNLFNMQVLGQANAEGFLDFRSRRFLSKLIRRNCIHVIGSDMHNLTSRPPKMEEAAIKIKKKFGDEFFSSLENNAVKIFNNERIK